MSRFLWAATAALMPGLAAAKIHVVDSLEWMAVNNPVVAAGTVNSVQLLSEGSEEGGAHFRDERVTVALTQKLKGAAGAAELRFQWRARGRTTAQSWKDSRHEVLFFFRTEKAGALTLDSENSTVDLQTQIAGWYPVVSMDLSRFKDRDAVLEAARRAIATFGGKPAGKPLVLDVPEDTEAFEALWGGSAVGLRVPKDYAKDFPPAGDSFDDWRVPPLQQPGLEQVKSGARAQFRLAPIDLFVAARREKQTVLEKDDCQFKSGTTVIHGSYQVYAVRDGALLGGSAELALRFAKGQPPAFVRLGQTKTGETLLSLPLSACEGAIEHWVVVVDGSGRVTQRIVTWANAGALSFDGDQLKGCVLNREKGKRICRVNAVGAEFAGRPATEFWE